MVLQPRPDGYHGCVEMDQWFLLDRRGEFIQLIILKDHSGNYTTISVLNGKTMDFHEGLHGVFGSALEWNQFLGLGPSLPSYELSM